MESWVASHFGELMIGAVLTIFGWAFRAWAGAIQKSTDAILTGLKSLQADFHQHRVEVERRVTRVETKVDILHVEKAVEGKSEHH